MAATPTVVDSNSQTATLTTEHTLYTTSTAGVYQLVVSATNLANGETLTLRVKRKVRSADGAVETQYEAVFKHDQSISVITSPAIATATGADFTLRQDGGTGRAYSWSVEAL